MKKLLFIGTVIALASCNGGNNNPDAYGNFEADEVMISAELGGKIISLTKNEGDKVNKGELLCITDTANLVLQFQQLATQKSSVESQILSINAQIAVNDQQIANLQKDYERISKMKADGSATQKQFDDVEGQMELVKRQKSALQAQIVNIERQADLVNAQMNVLQDKISTATIQSPIDATVLEKYAEMGELATPGKSIYKIADISSLILRVYIAENQLTKAVIGNTVKVMIDNGDELKTIEGKVEWVAQQAEFTPKIIQTREERVKLVYAVKIRVPNDGTLKIGMPGDIQF